MNQHIVRLVILSSAIACATAHAQTGAFSMGLSGMVPVPVGPLVDNRNAGAGGIASLLFTPVAPSRLGIRLEVAGLPTETHANNAPGASLTVTNGSTVLLAGIGPEYTIPTGAGHFYTTVTGGVARIWAISAASSLATPGGGEAFSTIAGTRATNFAWGAGGGFVIPMASRIGANFGLRYYDLGRATYTTRYPLQPSVGGINGNGGTTPASTSTTGHHRTTFVAPSIGLVWHY